MKKGIILRDKCPMCNYHSSNPVYKRSFNEEIMRNYMDINYFGHADLDFLRDIDFEIVKCTKCRGYYQKYVLDDAKSDELYNDWIDPKLAQEWNKNNENENKRFYSHILIFAKNYLNRESSRIKVLDYGAGFGDSLLVANEMGFDTFAYEYSAERVQSLQDKGIKVIDDKSEQSFDFIIVNNVLEHLTSPAELLRNVFNKMSKNALCFISVPDCTKIEEKLADSNIITDPKDLQILFLRANINAFQHINFFTNSSLRSLIKGQSIKILSPFKQAGIKPVSAKSFLRPFYRYYFGTSFFLVKL
jgi:2-polyprenyl-3-methyl-5-hydroxy-6-metoxy-1,4-benzoquinol methylase